MKITINNSTVLSISKLGTAAIKGNMYSNFGFTQSIKSSELPKAFQTKLLF